MRLQNSRILHSAVRATMVSQGLQNAVEACVSQHRAQVIELTVRGEHGSRVIEVFIDAEQSVTSELCTQLAREISDLLNDRRLVDGPYRLTVSSPGLDRPLTFEWQYQKHMGRVMQLRTRSSTEEQLITGTLVGVENGGILLRVAGESQPLRVSFATILEAKIKTPW